MKREPDDGRDPTLTFDWTETYSPSVATVRAIAALHDTPADGLPPMYASVDTEGLDSLLNHQHRRNVDGLVSFEYHGHRVVLATDGDGRVYDIVGDG